VTRVRVRGIYATALTELLTSAGHVIVDPSEPIRERFDRSFDERAHDVTVETTKNRQGVEIAGDPDGVERIAGTVEGVGIDTFCWRDPTPAGAVYDGVVTDTLGGGAVLELGAGEGYLSYDAVDGYVEEDDHFRVQVTGSRPPWTDDRPELSPELRAPGGLVELVRGQSRPSSDLSSERATELTRTLDLLSADVPDGWGVHWPYAAEDADLEALEEALSRAVDRAHVLSDALDAGPNDDGELPRELAAPTAGRWAWFGRESRFELDECRRAVTTTMVGHHRTKAAHRAASSAVDLVEAVCADPTGIDGDADFPFGAVAENFGPRQGERLRIEHGKPDGRLYTLGRATVQERDPEGQVVLRREMRSQGEYDGLGTPREPGDVAITRIRDGRWWYPTAYRSEDGRKRGTYVNVCTPVEVFPDAVRYVDLHVDVVKRPDGEVERVDDEELEAAEDAGTVSPALAERARDVASKVEDAL